MDFAKILADLGHPLTGLVGLGVLWVLKDLRDLRLKVVELDTKMGLLLGAHKVVSDEPGPTTDLDGLRRSFRKR